jgi:hypothetical protein
MERTGVGGAPPPKPYVLNVKSYVEYSTQLEPESLEYLNDPSAYGFPPAKPTL